MKRNPLLVYGLTLAALILTALLLNKYDRRSSQALSIRDPSDSKPASDEIVCSVIDGETHIAQHGQHASMIAPRADKLISAPEPVMDYVRDDGTLAAGITRDDATHAGLLAGWELLLADNPTSVGEVITRLTIDTDTESVNILQYVLGERFSQSMSEADAAELFRAAESDISPQNRRAIISLLSHLPQINATQVGQLGQVTRATTNEQVKLETVNTMNTWMQKFPGQSELIAEELVNLLKDEQSPTVTAQMLQSLAAHVTALTADQQNVMVVALQSNSPNVRTHAAEVLGAMTGPGGQDAMNVLEKAQAREKDSAVSRVIALQLSRLKGEEPQP